MSQFTPIELVPELTLRVSQLQKGLCISPQGWTVGCALLALNRSVSVNSLAQITRINRSSVTNLVQRSIGDGYIVRDSKQSIVLTSDARRLFIQVIKGIYDISYGNQRGFSDDVLETFLQARHKDQICIEALKSVGFPKLSKFGTTKLDV